MFSILNIIRNIFQYTYEMDANICSPNRICLNLFENFHLLIGHGVHCCDIIQCCVAKTVITEIHISGNLF